MKLEVSPEKTEAELVIKNKAIKHLIIKVLDTVISTMMNFK